MGAGYLNETTVMNLPRLREGTLYAHGFVIAGTAVDQAKIPTAGAQKTLGITPFVDNNKDVVDVCFLGRVWGIDKAGSVANRTDVNNAGTNNFWKFVDAGDKETGQAMIDGAAASAADGLAMLLIQPVHMTLTVA